MLLILRPTSPFRMCFLPCRFSSWNLMYQNKFQSLQKGIFHFNYPAVPSFLKTALSTGLWGHQELEDRTKTLEGSFSARTQQTALARPSGHVGDAAKHRQRATWPVFTMTSTAFCCCQPEMASSKSCLYSVSVVFSAELILWPPSPSLLLW